MPDDRAPTTFEDVGDWLSFVTAHTKPVQEGHGGADVVRIVATRYQDTTTAVDLSPRYARAFARLLDRLADEAEGG